MNDYVSVSYQAKRPERWLGEEVMVSMSYEQDELSDPEIVTFPARVSEEAIFPESDVLTLTVYEPEALREFSEEEIEQAVREAMAELEAGWEPPEARDTPLASTLVRAGAMMGGGLH